MNNKAHTGQLTEQQRFDIRAEFQAREIEEHKYYLSEKYGYDVGIEKTTLDWIDSGHAERFAERFSHNEENIVTYYARNSHAKHTESNGYHFSIEEIHYLLGDV